jgi:peptidylprolyl isomerase
VYDKDLKPVMGADNKPEQAPAQPIRFLQGTGRVIPGWEQGFYGMKVGGKRRLFIPWQLAYGVKGHPTNDPKNPGIPAKADLIFDVELVAVNDVPAQAPHPGMGGMPPGHPMPMGSHPGMPGAPGAPAPAPAPGAPAAAPTPAAPSTAPATPAAPPAAQPATPAAPATPAQPQSR